jgi:hypothetical protein
MSLPVVIFALRRMDIRFEQRVNIKFCVKLGKTATETLQLLRDATALKHYLGLKERLKGRRHNIEVIQAAAPGIVWYVPMLISAGTVLVLYLTHFLFRLYLGRLLKFCNFRNPRAASVNDAPAQIT